MRLTKLSGRYGIQAILMSGLFFLIAVCGTGCSDKEISSLEVCTEPIARNWEYYGTVAFDDRVSSKVFIAEDEMTKDIYRVILPDTLQSTAEGELWLKWFEPITIINVDAVKYISPHFAMIVSHTWVPQKSRNGGVQLR